MSRRELDLERALADLAAALEFLPRPSRHGRPGWTRPRRAAAPPSPAAGRRWLAGLAGGGGRPAGLAVVLLAAAVLMASPGTREAVARRLGLRGIGVELGGPPPPTVTTTPGGRLELGLGDRVPLEEARRRVAWPVLVPATAGLGRPDAVLPQRGRARRRPGGPRLPGPPGPPPPFTDVGLLITEFQSQPTPSSSRRSPSWAWSSGVTVGGEPGYWFSGEPHFFTYRDAAGTLREEQTRLAGNTNLAAVT